MAIYINIPKKCPFCNSETIVKTSENGIKTLWCSNDNCDSKLINRLDHFCGKKGLDIKGISKATLEKLINWGFIQDLDDIFNLHQVRNLWIEKPGFGEKSVDKIINAIELARTTTLDKVISSIGIPLIGSTVSKDLAKRFKTYANFRKHINEGYDFSQLDGYGSEMTHSLLTFDYRELDALVDFWINIQETEETQQGNGLEGAIFVITGKLKHFKNRDELKAVIESLGGKVSGSVTKNTDFLINNDINSTSAKNKKAKELEVDIITEEDFLKIFDKYKNL